MIKRIGRLEAAHFLHKRWCSFNPRFPNNRLVSPAVSTTLSCCSPADHIPTRFRQTIVDSLSTRKYSTQPTNLSSLIASELTPQEYHQISDETLNELADVLETLVESDHAEVDAWDLDFSSGVMTFSMGKHGTYVINKQPPNKQIWLSSPFSGPKRFDYDRSQKCWFYHRDGSQLHQLLSEEIDKVLGDHSLSKLFSAQKPYVQ